MSTAPTHGLAARPRQRLHCPRHTPHACRGKHLTWVNILQYGLGVVAAIIIFILGWIYAKKAMALIEARARERSGKRDDGVLPTASDAARQVGLHPAKADASSQG